MSDKQNILAILDVFIEAQQKLETLKIGDYELLCTSRFESRAYFEIWHDGKLLHESASLFDAIIRTFEYMGCTYRKDSNE